MTPPSTARRRPPGRYDPPSRVAPRLLALLLTLLLVGLVAAIGNLIWTRTTAEQVEAQVVAYELLDEGERVRVDLEISKPAGSPAYCLVRARSREGAEVGRDVVAVGAGDAADERVRLTHVLETSGRAATAEAGRCSASPIPTATPAP